MKYLNEYVAGLIPNDKYVTNYDIDMFFIVKSISIGNNDITLLEYWIDQKISNVTYKNTLLLPILEIFDFHEKNYPNITLTQEIQLSVDKYSYHVYLQRKLVQYFINTFTKDNKYKNYVLFDGDYNLVEYSEKFYSQEGIQINTKYFLAQHWVIDDDN